MFRYIKEKVWNRLQSWKEIFLSQAEKEILLKVVIQSIPSYVKSEHHMNKFWWLSNMENRGGIKWMTWDRPCYPKKLEGMGFRRVKEFNLVMLGKKHGNI